MKSTIIILAIGLLLFEFIEHVIFPLIWFIKDRKRKSVCGVTGMLGKVGEIKQYQQTEGQVFVNGELWRALSDVPLLPGDKVIIQAVDGLTLRVKPCKD
ncbi:MAG: NfeD family protein [Desulfatiglandaceae bacterium]